MKPRLKFTIATIFAISVAAGALHVSSLKAQTQSVTRTEILKTDLVGMDGYEGVMYVTDVAPGGVAPRHWHPGYEFNYVLKGALKFEPDGEAPLLLKAGQATFNPMGHVHKVSNASTTEPAQLVVVLIHQKGKPLAIPVQ